jgi:hypothetical protein
MMLRPHSSANAIKELNQFNLSAGFVSQGHDSWIVDDVWFRDIRHSVLPF